ncbi:hypothetical protein MBLNU457_1612t1 [Dothideomycetes sp. NU457]
MRGILKRAIVYPLLAFSLVEAENGSNTTSVSAQSSATIKSNPSTETGVCEPGTVNYITHTLPQQCATSVRPTITPDTGSAPHASSQTGSTTSVQVITNSSHPSPRIDATSASSADTTIPTQSASVVESSIDPDTPTTTITTTSAVPVPTIAAETVAELETDSPLDHVNFLSFEDWKKQNLAKAGQSPEHVGQHRGAEDMHKRTRPGINNALDVLGEDSEIELDFSGFGAATQSQGAYNDRSQQEDGNARSDPAALEKAASQPALRSKDAGKTCKERTNYASFDCAATVLKSNKECKSASSVLVENKDSYMLNVCSVKNKFFIVELCDDILIDTVVLANYEFFSSIFRTFRISVSDRYPVKAEKWRELGVYEARNTRDVQAFLVDQPLIWARYLRIEFLTHFGNEYYCPVSLLRVHGTTMMEEFRHQEELARGELPEDLTETEGEDEEGEDAPSETIAQEPMQESKAADGSAVQITDKVSSATADDNRATTSSEHPVSAVVSAVSSAFATSGHTTSSSMQHTEQSAPRSTETSSVPTSSVQNTSAPIPTSTTNQSSLTSSREGIVTNKVTSSPLAATTSVAQDSANNTITPFSLTKSDVSAERAPSPKANNTQAQDQSKPQSEPSQSPKPSLSSTNTTHIADTTHKKPPGYSSSAAAPIPSTQESFFKSISKRLSTLESNATLSLQYIESQSLQLRSAFTAVEKRQIAKTESFLSALNTSISAELSAFRRDYEQLWQSTVIELENQRRGYREENTRLERRLEGLADEVLWQKRMVVVQSTLLSLCLGLVIFARVGVGSEAVGAVWARASQGRGGKGWTSTSPSPGWSPALSPVSAKRGTREGSPLWRRVASEGALSDDGAHDTPAEETEEHDTPPRQRPELMFQPPTPRMVDAGTDEGLFGKLPERREVDELKPLPAQAGLPAAVAGTQSSPSTPTGSRDPTAFIANGSGTDSEVSTAEK